MIARPVGPYGARYDDAIDLGALAQAHTAKYRERQTITVDGNVAAAIPEDNHDRRRPEDRALALTRDRSPFSTAQC